MLTRAELKAVLAGLDVKILSKLYDELGRGRVFEAERIMTEQTGDGTVGAEIVASMIRQQWREVTK